MRAVWGFISVCKWWTGLPKYSLHSGQLISISSDHESWCFWRLGGFWLDFMALSLWIVLGWRNLQPRTLHVGDIIQEKEPQVLTAVLNLFEDFLLHSTFRSLPILVCCSVSGHFSCKIRPDWMGARPIVQKYGSSWCLLWLLHCSASMGRILLRWCDGGDLS